MLSGLRSRVIGATADDDDGGQVLLLSIGFALVCLLLVTVVVSATSVHLERKRLVALADSLAVAAADELDLEAYYRGEAAEPESGGAIALTDASVRAAVAEHLEQTPGAGRFAELRVARAHTPDGRTAEVELTARARVVLWSWVLEAWSDGIALSASASARAW